MNKNESIRVTNIQRMCFHDGPGIRTTVFLKGCSLHCPWCSNPENISFDVEEYSYEGKDGIYGKDYDPDELYEEIVRDKAFWGNEGGVTFSGGEPLLQIHRLIPLLEKLKDEGTNIAVETSLFVPCEYIRIACEYVDYCIADIKILDAKVCKTVLGGNVDTYFNNLKMVYEAGRLKLFRIPLCYEYTYFEENRNRIKDFLSDYRDIPVQIFGIHRMGEKKYKSLGKTCWNNQEVSEEDFASFCEELRVQGIDAETIKM